MPRNFFTFAVILAAFCKAGAMYLSELPEEVAKNLQFITSEGKDCISAELATLDASDDVNTAEKKLQAIKNNLNNNPNLPGGFIGSWLVRQIRAHNPEYCGAGGAGAGAGGAAEAVETAELAAAMGCEAENVHQIKGVLGTFINDQNVRMIVVKWEKGGVDIITETDLHPAARKAHLQPFLASRFSGTIKSSYKNRDGKLVLRVKFGNAILKLNADNLAEDVQQGLVKTYRDSVETRAALRKAQEGHVKASKEIIREADEALPFSVAAYATARRYPTRGQATGSYLLGKRGFIPATFQRCGVQSAANQTAENDSDTDSDGDVPLVGPNEGMGPMLVGAAAQLPAAPTFDDLRDLVNNINTRRDRACAGNGAGAGAGGCAACCPGPRGEKRRLNTVVNVKVEVVSPQPKKAKIARVHPSRGPRAWSTVRKVMVKGFPDLYAAYNHHGEQIGKYTTIERALMEAGEGARLIDEATNAVQEQEEGGGGTSKIARVVRTEPTRVRGVEKVIYDSGLEHRYAAYNQQGEKIGEGYPTIERAIRAQRVEEAKAAKNAVQEQEEGGGGTSVALTVIAAADDDGGGAAPQEASVTVAAAADWCFV